MTFTSSPMERAEPSIMRMAASMRIAVQILHLLLGDLAHLRLGHRAGDVAARRLRAAFESSPPS